MVWSGWRPWALMSRTRGSRCLVTMDITEMSAGAVEKKPGWTGPLHPAAR
jgi:hypothetical protein